MFGLSFWLFQQSLVERMAVFGMIDLFGSDPQNLPYANQIFLPLHLTDHTCIKCLNMFTVVQYISLKVTREYNAGLNFFVQAVCGFIRFPLSATR